MPQRGLLLEVGPRGVSGLLPRFLRQPQLSGFTKHNARARIHLHQIGFEVFGLARTGSVTRRCLKLGLVRTDNTTHTDCARSHQHQTNAIRDHEAEPEPEENVAQHH